MLIEHRVNDMGESLVGSEESMPSGQEITFQPPLQSVLAEHLHDVPVTGEFTTIRILGLDLRHPCFLRGLVHGSQTVGSCFIRPEHPKLVQVITHDIAQEYPENLSIPSQDSTGFFHLKAIVSEVGQTQGLANCSSISDRVCAHS